MPIVATLLAFAPAGAVAKNGGHDPRARCAAVSALLEDVLPDLVRPGEVVVRQALGIPVDIFAPPAGLHGTQRRLTSDSIFWKSGFAPGTAPSPELVSNWLAVQQYSATDCAGRLLARRRIAVQPDFRGAWRHPEDRVLAIGYPAFDRSGRDALLYVIQGGPYLTGEEVLLRFTKVNGHWKQTARVHLGST